MILGHAAAGPSIPQRHLNVRFSLIGRLGSSAFRPSTTAVSMSLAGSCFSTESAHRPFHHGIRRRDGTIFWAALPSAGPSGHANSPHPSSREGHHSTAWWSSSFLLLLISRCSRCNLPGPSELGAINPDAMHDHGQAAGQRDNRSFHATTLGDLHRPSLEPGPSCRTQHALCCFVEHCSHHLVSAARYGTRSVSFTGLVSGAGQPKYRAYGFGSAEPSWHVDRGAIGERHYW